MGAPPASAAPSRAGDAPGSIRDQITMGSRRARRRLAAFAVVVVVGMSAGFLLTAHPPHPLAAGAHMPPFAVPSARGSLPGDANVATRSGEGTAGARPACSVRGSEVVNICQLEEAGPVVLALFINKGSGPHILRAIQRLAGEFPTVRFVGVGLGGDRRSLHTWLRAEGVTVPVGYDHDGAVAALYDMLEPEIVLARRGGVVQSKPLYDVSDLATLRAQVRQLVAAERTHSIGHTGGAGAGR